MVQQQKADDDMFQINTMVVVCKVFV